MTSTGTRKALTRLVPRIFCLRGQTPHTYTGVSRIQISDQYMAIRNSPARLPPKLQPPPPPPPPAMYGPLVRSSV